MSAECTETLRFCSNNFDANNSQIKVVTFTVPIRSLRQWLKKYIISLKNLNFSFIQNDEEIGLKALSQYLSSLYKEVTLKYF